MAVVRKKQDDKYLKVLRELVTTGGGNRQCFDCGQKGPTYVNMTIGSFVCTRCSGVLRGLTPPHRVKSISMATFTQEEIGFLKAHGNDLCAKTWLGLWDPKRAVHQDHRELMIDKYERKRYYLEPASPLKSLTNAASLTKTNTSASAATASTQNSHSNNGNSHAPLTNGYNKQPNIIDNNNFQNIQLTPPASQRNTVNGLHKTSASTSTTAISRPQHTQHQQLQNGYAQHQDAFMMINNGLNGLSTTNNNNGLNTSVGSSSTAALSDTSSCASANGFGPDADFVADFGSASIFDATSASSVGSPAASSASSVASSNGYAKIQPIKATHQHQQQQQQQHHHFMNGNVVNSKQHVNGTSSVSNGGKGSTENFADFDHAPIFNAAENYQFVRKTNAKKKLAATSHLQQQQQQHQKKKQQLSNIIDTNERFANLKQSTTTTKASITNAVGNKKESNGEHNSNNNNNSTTTTIKSPPDIRFSESTTNFHDPFDDFSTIIKNNNNNNTMNNFAATFVEGDYNNAQQIQSQETPSSTKFTPLAMAAHATAMAVLGSNYHYNSNNHAGSVVVGNNFSEYRTPLPSENHWNVWQESILNDSAAAYADNTSTPITPINISATLWPATNGDGFGGSDDNSASNNNNRYARIAGKVVGTDATTATSAYNLFSNNNVNARDGNFNTLNYTVATTASTVAGMAPAATLSMSSSDTTSSYSTTTPSIIANITPSKPCVSSFSYSNPFRIHFNENCDSYSNCDSDSVPVGIFARNCNSPSSSSVDENSNSYCDSFPYWSLPIPKGSTATSSNAFNNNNNNNNKLSSTPGEDRYAALKDLDEQLRESKAVAAAAASMVSAAVVDSFGNNANNNNNIISNANSNVNPFKSQQQQQNATMVNPFQHGAQPPQQHIFCQMTGLPNGIGATTTQQPSQQQPQQQQPQQTLGATGFFSYSNGFTAATTEGGVGSAGAMFPTAMMPTSVGPTGGPNGCGFGFGTMQQQIAATGGGMGGGVFNNPFAAASGAMNSNNPFL